ncbi:glycosyltransferase [Acuticoccus sp. MNP-M23]|uniref:glycosyltransferase n=1 Tax=Acuticoccus sp. MNP-M23 TaxID=3072793 RepID=UPI0035BF07CF
MEKDAGGELWQIDEARHAHVLYSGDLNNRIDWALLDGVAALVGARGGVLHIVGSSERVQKELTQLLRRPQCVYHGAMRERAVMSLAGICDFAVVPHLHDGVSAFMNPLKIKMYTAFGLPHVVTDVAGLDTSSDLTLVADDNDDFLSRTRALLAGVEGAGGEKRRIEGEMALSEDAARYCALVADIFAAVAELYGPLAEPAEDVGEPFKSESAPGPARGWEEPERQKEDQTEGVVS